VCLTHLEDLLYVLSNATTAKRILLHERRFAENPLTQIALLLYIEFIQWVLEFTLNRPIFGQMTPTRISCVVGLSADAASSRLLKPWKQITS